MKLVYHGPLWHGGTALQRAQAFAGVTGVNVVQLDTMRGVREQDVNVYERVRWRLGWPVDSLDENARLIDLTRRERPDAILVDNSKVLTPATLRTLREICDPVLVYYSPDDIMAVHNLKKPLHRSFPLWDLVFTTKSYNVAELRAAGVVNPVLIGKSYDPVLHRPLTPAEVGEDFERFDVVFIGAFERERAGSLVALAEAGLSVLVHGSRAGLLAGDWINGHANLTLRPPVFAEDYARCLHHGKIALCFLRKINRDRITQRSVELPAMVRPMLAEKTDEHDAHFADGIEYVGFGDDANLVSKAQALLADPERRRRIAEAGFRRCKASGYAIADRAARMVEYIDAARAARRAAGFHDDDVRL